MDQFGSRIRNALHPRDFRNTAGQLPNQAAAGAGYGWGGYGSFPGQPAKGPGPCPPGYKDVTQGDPNKVGRRCAPPGGACPQGQKYSWDPVEGRKCLPGSGAGQ
jgi:hypothetical protein